ncbi:hypothetical protein [Nonomuraea sp. CA-141351]|uniref:hypothetical protein n=1 Tax=Nonomuraea sp. CA-141351 TaxID=3239996 RepID=UPI003D89DBD5
MTKVLIVAGVAFAVLAAVAAVFIVISPGTEADPPAPPVQASPAQVAPPPTLLDVSGRVVLKTWPGQVEYGDHPACSGKGEYADIRQGAQVVVTDAAGKTIGVGKLGSGVHVEEGCVFRWALAVAPGADFYGVEVSHRGLSKYSAAQMSLPVELVLGER